MWLSLVTIVCMSSAVQEKEVPVSCFFVCLYFHNGRRAGHFTGHKHCLATLHIKASTVSLHPQSVASCRVHSLGLHRLPGDICRSPRASLSCKFLNNPALQWPELFQPCHRFFRIARNCSSHLTLDSSGWFQLCHTDFSG